VFGLTLKDVAVIITDNFYQGNDLVMLSSDLAKVGGLPAYFHA
jgi:hypothetical protein